MEERKLERKKRIEKSEEDHKINYTSIVLSVFVTCNNQLSTSAQQFFFLLLDWTTCFDRLIGHPQVLLYCEVS